MRAIEDNRFVRREGANYRPSVRIDVQLKGPPNVSLNEAALRLGSPLGAAEGGYRPLHMNRKPKTQPGFLSPAHDTVNRSGT
jgi:hypothetical protein